MFHFDHLNQLLMGCNVSLQLQTLAEMHPAPEPNFIIRFRGGINFKGELEKSQIEGLRGQHLSLGVLCRKCPCADASPASAPAKVAIYYRQKSKAIDIDSKGNLNLCLMDVTVRLEQYSRNFTHRYGNGRQTGLSRIQDVDP